MDSGDILCHDRFYRDSTTGQIKRKFLVFLAPTPGGDWVARLLTSQANLRVEVPICSHAHPYPGYYLGIPGGALTRKTWVNLRWLADFDFYDVVRLTKVGTMRKAAELRGSTLNQLLACAADAIDTTRQQERALRDQIALISS